VTYHSQKVLESDMRVLRERWKRPPIKSIAFRGTLDVPMRRRKNIYDRKGPSYVVPFKPKSTPAFFSRVKTSRTWPSSGRRGATAIGR